MDRRPFYDERAAARPRELDRGYHRLLEHYYASIIPQGMKVLEVGCGIGDLLQYLKPSRGVGVDFSPRMIELARARNPELEFSCADAHSFECSEQFDYIVLSDLVNDVADVQALLTNLRKCSHSRTRLVLNFFNNLWRPGLQFAEAVGWKAPTKLQSWLSNVDMQNLLHLAGWEVITTETRILWPSTTPFIGTLFNRWLAPILWPLNLTVFQVARLAPDSTLSRKDFSCTVVVPARNEAGNIEAAVLRTPEMGKGVELIFIEGHSKDNTWAEILRVQAKYPHKKIVALKQQSKGKGGAVREAFAQATGELLFILDADLTMPPEQLPKFYEAASSGKGEFINGVRLVYPMEEEAMQFLNMIANKTFGILFSWLMGQPVKDTLCGTKVLLREDYEKIARNRSYFGDFDPFGDFDLLFGASKLNLKIIDMPIRYAARTYGETNIHRWSHGWLLLRMVIFAAKRLKFI
ncbi:MAG TPA: bifunctional class I SAM-dependent methyltransferase/glycosyltransferase family 2 protein [Methylomirabilota bacterium]|nr:bifunctional class I SAM-dependent methyltransferase/glycosyltransferase family 2 protein [Methylomirabilota bacterium]